MMAVMEFHAFIQHVGLTKSGAASEVVLCWEEMCQQSEDIKRIFMTMKASSKKRCRASLKYFFKVQDYMRAYREQHTPGSELEKAVKQIKSHHCVCALNCK